MVEAEIVTWLYVNISSFAEQSVAAIISYLVSYLKHSSGKFHTHAEQRNIKANIKKNICFKILKIFCFF